MLSFSGNFVCPNFFQQFIQRGENNQLTTLRKLSLPLCAYLDINTENASKENYEVRSLASLMPSMKNLEHFEVKKCGQLSNEDGVKVLETLHLIINLKTLVLCDVTLNVSPYSSGMEKLFNSCSNLSELHLSSINCQPQKLFLYLEKGLKSAFNLKILKLYQKNVTHYSERIFNVIKKTCQKLEQFLTGLSQSDKWSLKTFRKLLD